ncbi:hypothetical protein HOC35_05445 [Candidatus Woesearchaeota archaeon]|jgi:uncharacterized protein|nr:hypothetical protein [Candidatus Woesearchaeota archaeon]
MPEFKKILLDTNFLMIPGNFGIDIFEEIDRICNFNYKLYIVDKTIDELEKLPEKVQNQKTATKTAVNIALKLIETLGKEGKLNIIPTKTNNELKAKYEEMYVDEIIIKLANEYIVATTDTELKKHLKKMIILRQKRYLELIE